MLLLSMLCSILHFGTAQNTVEHIFESGIKGIEFDNIQIHRVFPQPDGGLRVFLGLQRKGAVQEKKLPGWEGGNKEVALVALGVVDFSKDFKLIKEEVSFDKPVGVFSKEYNLLDRKFRPGVNTIATHANCVDSKLDWLTMYPELKTPEDKRNAPPPVEVFFEPTVRYSGLALKPESFHSEKNTLVRQESTSEKTFLQWLFTDDETASLPKYESQKTEVTIEPYRNSSKSDFWQREEEPVGDPATGVVLAHHTRFVQGEKQNRSQLFYRELVAFDKDGKEINRTEMNFEKPHRMALHQPFFEGKEKAARLKGLVQVYGEYYGFGMKKLNPTPNKLAHKFYHWDNQGKLLAQVDFDLPEEEAKIITAFENNGAVCLLVISSNTKAQYALNFAGGKLTGTGKLDPNGSVAQNFQFTNLELPDARLRVLHESKLPDGSMLSYANFSTMYKGAQVGAPTTYKYRGLLIAHIGADGKVVNLTGIKRMGVSDLAKAPGYTFFSSENGKCLFSMTDPGISGVDDISIYSFNEKDDQLAKLYSSFSHNLLGSREDRIYIPEANTIIYTGIKDGHYQMSFIRP